MPPIPPFLYKWIAIGLAILGLAAAVYVQHLRLQACDATRELYEGWIEQAKEKIADAKKTNDENVGELARLRGDHDAQVRELEKEIARLKAQEPEVRIIRERIAVAPKCGAVSPALRDAAEWLRTHPASADGDH